MPPEQLIEQKEVDRLFDAEVKRTLDGFAIYERPRRVALLPRLLTEEAGELTPSLKTKNRVVLANWPDKIAYLFDEKSRSPISPLAESAVADRSSMNRKPASSSQLDRQRVDITSGEGPIARRITKRTPSWTATTYLTVTKCHRLLATCAMALWARTRTGVAV